MPSGAKKRRAAKRRQQREADIKSSSDSKGLSWDTGSPAIDDANVLVLEDIAVDDLAKPVVTLDKGVDELESKENEEKIVHENILDEPHSVMENPIVVELAKPIGLLSEEVSNITLAKDVASLEKENEEKIEHENVLEEPHSVMKNQIVVELAKPIVDLSEEVSDIDVFVTENVAEENIEQLFTSLQLNILEEPHPAMDTLLVDGLANLVVTLSDEPHPASDTLLVDDLAKLDVTLSDGVSVDYKVTEDVVEFGLKDNDEEMQQSVNENILVEPNSVADVTVVGDLDNRVAADVTNVDGVIEDVVISGLKENEEKLLPLLLLDIMDEPCEIVAEFNEAVDVLKASSENDEETNAVGLVIGDVVSSGLKDFEIVSELNEAEYVLEASYENVSATIGLVSEENEDKNLDSPSAETSIGTELVIESEHKGHEPECAPEQIHPDQCALHCTFYQWISKELNKTSTAEVNRAEDVFKSMRCLEQLDRIKKLAETELQVADKMGMLLRNLLNDLNSFKVTEGEGLSTREI